MATAQAQEELPDAYAYGIVADRASPLVAKEEHVEERADEEESDGVLGRELPGAPVPSSRRRLAAKAAAVTLVACACLLAGGLLAGGRGREPGHDVVAGPQHLAAENFLGLAATVPAAIPPPGAEISEPKVTLVGASGVILTMLVPKTATGGIDSTATEAKAVQQLQAQQLIQPGASTGWNFQWYWDGALTSKAEVPALEIPGHLFKLKVTLDSEKMLSPELVQYVRSLPVDAKSKSQLSDQLRKQTVTDMSGLQTIDPATVAAAVPGLDEQTSEILTSKLETAQSQQALLASNGAAEEPEPPNLQEKAEKQADELQAKAEQLQQAVSKATKDAAANGLKELSATTKADMDKLQKNLADFKLSAVDMKAAGKSEVAALTANGMGTLSGKHLNVKQLIYYHGLFRGVRLSTSITASQLEQVVDFNPAYAKKKSAELDMELLVKPDAQATEVTLESTSVGSMQRANKVIETLGMTEFKSQQSSGSFGLSIMGTGGGGGLGASASKSSSSGSSTDDSKAGTDMLSKQSKTYVRTHYLMEPKATIKITARMLSATPYFNQRWRKLKKDAEEQVAARRLAATVSYAKVGEGYCDYYFDQPSADSADDCAKKCHASTSCNLFTFGPQMGCRISDCTKFPQEGVACPADFQCILARKKYLGTVQNVYQLKVGYQKVGDGYCDYYYNDDGTSPSFTVDQCAEKCRATKDCRKFSIGGGLGCRYSTSTKYPKKGVAWDADKQCILSKTPDYNGQIHTAYQLSGEPFVPIGTGYCDYYFNGDGTTAASSVADCAAACKAKPGCTTFSFGGRMGCRYSDCGKFPKEGVACPANKQCIVTKGTEDGTYFGHLQTLYMLGTGAPAAAPGPTPPNVAGFATTANGAETGVNAGGAASIDKSVGSALFSEFGTHVCPSAQLGGWWRISAQYTSVSSKQAVSMSKATAEAIQRSEDQSFGVAAKGSGKGKKGAAAGTAGFASGSASNSQNQQSYGAKDLQSLADSKSTINVNQVWKGGQSGGTKAQWRDSLADEYNSRWNVIDRYSADCIGIWNFIEDVNLKTTMCAMWRDDYAIKSGLTPAQQTALLGNACQGGKTNLQGIRAGVAAQKAQTAEEERQKNKGVCDQTAGKHWNAKKSTCDLNVCTCPGKVQGALGVDCETNGAEKCSTSQRAKCSTLGQCPSGQHKNPSAGNQLCVASLCSAGVDFGTCCMDNFYGSNFAFQAKTTNEVHHGPDYVKFCTMDGSKCSGDGIGVYRENNNGLTGYEICTSGQCEGGVDTWDVPLKDASGNSMAPFLVGQVCIWAGIHDDAWAIEWLKVRNSELPWSTAKVITAWPSAMKSYLTRQWYCRQIG